MSGLGNTALFNPPLPQLSQSLNRPPGEAIKDCSIYRDGNADTGVSIVFLFSEYALEFCCDVGGGGLAKGFGGPEAPAESKAEAEGEGGGSSIPLWLRSGFADRVSAPRGEPEPDSSSSASDGIVRLSLGRAAPFEPLVSLRCGAANSLLADAVVVARTGCDGAGLSNCDDGCEMALGGGLISGGDWF